jgi:chromosome segregation ATPase
MGFGDTAKKIQTLADKAERTYQKINELRSEVEETQTTVLDTSERVQRLENEMAEQRAVLDAVAEEVGVDLESVSTEAHITDAEEVANGTGGDGAETDDRSDDGET